MPTASAVTIIALLLISAYRFASHRTPVPGEQMIQHRAAGLNDSVETLRDREEQFGSVLIFIQAREITADVVVREVDESDSMPTALTSGLTAGTHAVLIVL
jgi:hypothetical protein